MHAKTDSDDTSYGLSSQGSPKRPVYYVNSPSRDSHDASNSPMESPPSTAHHSRASSASRISGSYNPAFGKKGNRKRNEKGWPEPDCKVIEEEGGGYGDIYHDRKELSRRTQFFIAVIGFVLVFSFFCLIIWAASLHYKPQLSIKV